MVNRGLIGALMTGIMMLCVHKVQTANITVIPEQIAISNGYPSSNLSITCSPDDPVVTRVIVMEIGKKSPDGSVENAIVQISMSNSSVIVKDTSLMSRMRQSGFITGASGQLGIVLSDIRCSDANTYYCVTVVDAGARSEDSASFSVRTYPDNVEMVVTPDNSQYQQNTQVNFTCHGWIGNTFDMGMANTWVWEWRYIEGANTQWTRYPNIKNITNRTPASNGSCQYSGSTTLIHTLTRQDNNRQFRCYVVSEEYGGTKTLALKDSPVTKPPVSPVTKPPVISGSQNTKAMAVTMWMTAFVLLLCVEM